MNTSEQIKKYKKYIEEYSKSNKIGNKENIRNDLKLFSRNIKAAIKVALEDSIDEYGHEGIYMFTMAYLHEYSESYFWNVINTEDKYEEVLKKLINLGV